MDIVCLVAEAVPLPFVHIILSHLVAHRIKQLIRTQVLPDVVVHRLLQILKAVLMPLVVRIQQTFYFRLAVGVIPYLTLDVATLVDERYADAGIRTAKLEILLYLKLVLIEQLVYHQVANGLHFLYCPVVHNTTSYAKSFANTQS